MTHTLRYVVVSGAFIICSIVILATFWYQDWVYSLPTPKPKNFIQPEHGTYIRLAEFGVTNHNDRPWLLHFTNPSCPCSKFNIDHIHMLEKRFGKTVNFLAVIQSEEPHSAHEDFKSFDLDMPFIQDSLGILADACGVYSTPQAVILDARGRLLYCGNYNSSRYCTDPNTEFARIVLDSITSGKRVPSFPAIASVAYGCQLYSDTAALSKK